MRGPAAVNHAIIKAFFPLQNFNLRFPAKRVDRRAGPPNA